jgi:hypothetical protein
MPLSADPNDLIPYVLECDRALPEGERPTFYFRFLTDSENRKAARLILQADKESEGEDDTKAAASLSEAILMALANWERVKLRGESVPFGARPISDVLTSGEMWELAYASRREQIMTEKKRRNSASPSPADPAASAGSAPEPGASTLPPPANQ